MATIDTVADSISRIANGIESNVADCMVKNSGTVRQAVLEQLFSGIDGDGNKLSPNYDDDPFFNEEGMWYHRQKDYKAWKASITPPQPSPMLGLPARSLSTPNLYINGKFYSEIFTAMRGSVLEIDPGMGDGPDIVDKWGEKILKLSPIAKEYFIDEKLTPFLLAFYKSCGYGV